MAKLFEGVDIRRMQEIAGINEAAYPSSESVPTNPTAPNISQKQKEIIAARQDKRQDSMSSKDVRTPLGQEKVALAQAFEANFKGILAYRGPLIKTDNSGKEINIGERYVFEPPLNNPDSLAGIDKGVTAVLRIKSLIIFDENEKIVWEKVYNSLEDALMWIEMALKYKIYGGKITPSSPPDLEKGQKLRHSDPQTIPKKYTRTWGK